MRKKRGDRADVRAELPLLLGLALAKTPQEIRGFRAAEHPQLDVRALAIRVHARMLADGLLQHIHIAHVGADQMIVLRGYDAEFLALRLFIRETVEPAARR